MAKPLPPTSPDRQTEAAQSANAVSPAPLPAGGADAPLLSRTAHWRRVHRMTLLLLLLWLLTGFCAAFFARELAGLSVFGWPLSFYLAAQGASLVYLGIIVFYAWRMRKLDRAAGAPEPHA